MSLIIVDLGEAAILDNGLTGVAYDLRLFTNDVTSGLTPSEIDQLDETDFTEAAFTGYSAASVGTGDWTVTQDNPTQAINVEKSFLSTADQTAETIRGYHLTRTSDGALILFEEFDPITIEFEDDEILVTPTVTLDDAEGNAVETGTITAYGGTSAPTGWLLCDGSAVSRSTEAALFAVIGTAYGIGDGSTTFNLPDYRQRFPMGKADSGTGATLGGTGGDIDHVHGLDTASSHARINVSTTGVPYQAQKTGLPEWTATRQGDASGSNSTAMTTSGTELAGDSDTANPPFQTANFIIKA